MSECQSLDVLYLFTGMGDLQTVLTRKWTPKRSEIITVIPCDGLVRGPRLVFVVRVLSSIILPSVCYKAYYKIMKIPPDICSGLV